MRISPRHRPWRAIVPAVLACLIALPFLTGCGEDRSNLIPTDTSASLIAKLNEVDRLVAAGNCFDAKEVAASVQEEIETLNENIDPRLKRSLLDGVTQLQVFVGDPGKCTESDTVTTDEPEDTVEEPSEPDGTTGVTGATGTTDTEGTTGNQGTTDENQATEQPQDGDGGQSPSPPVRPNPTTPPTTPTPPTNPTTPVNPPSGGPGSGGLGPG